MARVHSAMSACRDSTERAHHSLRLILDHVGASAGYLFMRSGSGLQLAASESLEPPPGQLTASLQSVIDDCDTETKTALGVVLGRPTLELGPPLRGRPRCVRARIVITRTCCGRSSTASARWSAPRR